MATPSSDRIVFNGVNASAGPNRGKYLLQLSQAEVAQLALGEKYDEKHKQVIQARSMQAQQKTFGLEFGRDPNDLKSSGWGVIFPARRDPATLEPIREALRPLLELRKKQAGLLYKEMLQVDGYRPNDTADKFMRRHQAVPGTVIPRFLPYYLLIVGGPDEIPYRFQYEMDATYLVGRIDFETPEEYAQYAHSVVAAEETPLQLSRRAVFFGTSHTGDAATNASANGLVKPLADEIKDARQDWQVDYIPPADSRKDCLLGLLGKEQAPAFLFSATHGVGFDLGDPLQMAFQGSLLCQDLHELSPDISRDHYVSREDIADDFLLHGLISFHFACYGAGTPHYKNYLMPGQKKPDQIAPSNFLAALPRRLLSHPRGGALAVIGHVDLAWNYSFQWGELDAQTATFKDTLLRILAGQTVGLAVEQINARYTQVAARLSGMIDEAELVRPNPLEAASLWIANNDARGYALLGDPAVHLSVAPIDQPARAREALAPIQSAPDTDHPAASEANSLPAAGDVKPAESQQSFDAPAEKAQSPAPLTKVTIPTQEFVPSQQEGPTSPQGTHPDQELAALRSQLAVLAAQLDRLASDGSLPVDLIAAQSFATPGEIITDLGTKLRNSLRTLVTQLEALVSDIASLEVRTYSAADLDAVSFNNGKITGSVVPRALTHISLDGDTQTVLPENQGKLDEVTWTIHRQTVEQAQANRIAMLKAAIEMIGGMLRPTKTG